MSLHVRLERSDGILEGIPEEALPHISEVTILGPFAWVQLTYDHLRVSPDGDHVLHLANPGWMVIADGRDFLLISHYFSAADLAYPYSDVIVYTGGGGG